jgi:XTP/dITP diphosphohydrolase
VAGACEGSLLRSARGDGGFGYDPLFVPDGQTLTFAELDAGLKNRISHRARALARAAEQWLAFLATEPKAWPAA